MHIDDSPLRDRLAQVAAALGPLLLPLDPRDAHLTLAVAGFPSATPTLDDDVDPAHLAAQAQALRPHRPFPLTIGGARSFSAAPFLAVADPHGALAALRATLGAPAGPFTPHITLGLFAEDGPAAPILDALAPYAHLPPLPLTITAVHLLLFDGRRPNSPLRPHTTVPLAAG